MLHRLVVALVIVARCIVPSVSGADPPGPPTSPRLTELAAKLAAAQSGAEAAFWSQLASEGTPLIEDVHLPGRVLVSFVWRGKRDTGRVVVYGPVDTTNPEHGELARIPGSNVFALSLVLPDTARFSYGFDPSYVSAPGGKRDKPAELRDDPLNRRHIRTLSWCDLPNAPPQPWIVPRRDTRPGAVWDHEVTSTALGNKRAISVYTPAGFASTGAPYPLVVAFDRESALGSLALPVVLDELIAARRIPPVVVVLIGNVDRVKDLGASAAFGDFIALDVVPWVRAHYHAAADPRLTVVSGISLGGLAAAVAALHHPDVFGNVLSQSGSFWWPREADGAEPESTARAYAASARLPIRFWLEIGTLELGGIHIAANRHMRDVLTARGYDLTFREFAGVHDYMSWRGTIADGLVALLSSPPRPSPAAVAAPRGKPGGMTVTAARRSLGPTSSGSPCSTAVTPRSPRACACSRPARRRTLPTRTR